MSGGEVGQHMARLLLQRGPPRHPPRDKARTGLALRATAAVTTSPPRTARPLRRALGGCDALNPPERPPRPPPPPHRTACPCGGGPPPRTPHGHEAFPHPAQRAQRRPTRRAVPGARASPLPPRTH